MSGREVRALRGVLLACFATAAAAVSHSLAGGATPSIAGLALSLVFSTLACLALAGRALSLWRTTASVAVSQLLFHGLFSGLIASSAVVSPGNHHHGELAVLAPVAEVHGGHESEWMWAAHALAAMVTLLAARKGEQAICIVGSLTALVVRPLLAALAVHIAAPVAARVWMHADDSGTPLRLHILISPMRHRGPPELRFA